MNLLITGAWSGAKENVEKLGQMGHKVCFLQNEKDELPCDYDWVEGVVCNGLFLTHDIKKFSNLKYIQLTSAGMDRVPMDYVQEHKIEIHNARGVYSVPMAEYAVAGVLQLYKKQEFFSQNQKLHKWEKNRNLLELCGKKVCIIGCGDVGRECAKRFKAFGCDVIGVNRTLKQIEEFDKIYGLDDIVLAVSDADVVVVAIALTEQTKHMINAEIIAKLKPQAVIVNIARGAVIDTSALIDNIEGIGGAVLDVFDEEPLDENSQLWDIPNVIITPHNSFVSENNVDRINKIIFKNLGGV